MACFGQIQARTERTLLELGRNAELFRGWRELAAHAPLGFPAVRAEEALDLLALGRHVELELGHADAGAFVVGFLRGSLELGDVAGVQERTSGVARRGVTVEDLLCDREALQRGLESVEGESHTVAELDHGTRRPVACRFE